MLILFIAVSSFKVFEFFADILRGGLAIESHREVVRPYGHVLHELCFNRPIHVFQVFWWRRQGILCGFGAYDAYVAPGVELLGVVMKFDCKF